jgi:6-pyruvoyltetrahydropterin/6-carboxytetrahydropterin synthase
MPRVRLGREFSFDASHHLDWHGGKCKRLHGHTYRLLVEVSGQLDSNGIVWDFADMKEHIHTYVTGVLDHEDLNTMFSNPTAELMVQTIWQKLSSKMPSGIALETLRLYEGGDGYAEVRRTPTGT